MPPHRVTSACRQSTAPVHAVKSGTRNPYSPAATSSPAGPRSRTSRRPSPSSELTGSSNQHTPHSAANRSAQYSADLRVSAPLASVNSSVPSPASLRTAVSRSGSADGSREVLIFTRPIPSDTQDETCDTSRDSGQLVKPPLP